MEKAQVWWTFSKCGGETRRPPWLGTSHPRAFTLHIKTATENGSVVWGAPQPQFLVISLLEGWVVLIWPKLNYT